MRINDWSSDVCSSDLDSMRKSIFYAASALMALVCQPALAKEIKLNLTAKEVSTSVDNKGTMQASWTYEGQMPGPRLRVTEGDTITIVLTNDAATKKIGRAHV